VSVPSWREPEPWHRRFQSLMPFRARDILLVSSAYDAFVLEEDGSLSDRLFYQYSELNLSWAPRITHAATAEHALLLLEERRFDLVLTVVRIGGIDAGEISARIKERRPDIPVVLLVFDEADLAQFPGGKPPPTVERVFQWTGSAAVMIAVIKSVEDHRNVEHDTRAAGVQVILVVEDRPRAYSSFLGLLYPELMSQSGSLIAEGLNDFHRLLRMRARPKVLLATSFDDGLALYHRHQEYVCALMTDLRMPKHGDLAADAGLELAGLIHRREPDLPVLLQTAEKGAAEHAKDLGAWFVDKNAADFRSHVREFLREALGFGDFVFRLRDRTEVGRARDVFEMERALATVPAESIAFHASRNHFSMWLKARSMFPLARRIRPASLADFPDAEALRAHLIGALQDARHHEQAGVITDLGARHTGPENRFIRIGRGSIGGKGRSVAFVSTQIVRHRLLERFRGLEVRIPKTVALGTDAFDAFMEQVKMGELLALDDDRRVTDVMLEKSFPEEVLRDLRQAFDNLKGPLAVRSSSLLEDSRFQPFAGVYATYMLPNNDPDREARFGALVRAIQAVYASAFWRDARTYLAGTPHEVMDQKMAVVIQQVIGQRHGTRYYPPMSGVVQSYNFYPVGAQKHDDGVAMVALGLGHMVVTGGTALRFSPAAPTVLPQFATAASFLAGTQRQFYALNLAHGALDVHDGPEATLALCELEAAEADGTLAVAGSVYCAEDDVIRENLAVDGTRIVTFNNVLKWNSVPLAPALTELCALLRDGMGEEVEIEFALDLRVPAPDEPPERQRRGARLYVLQVRPMTSPLERQLPIDLQRIERDALLCRTDSALGHGSSEDIRDVVWVERDVLDAASGRQIVARVGEINARLAAGSRPYLLIGPGRWGSSDPTLGLGVGWAHISGARVIVETPIGERRVEPSQGTHFFRNITAARIAYLSVAQDAQSFLDRAWLEEKWRSSGAVEEVGVRHLTLDEPLSVHLDGRRGVAVIVKRGSLAR
jgi:CheY-like chemotaxis protein